MAGSEVEIIITKRKLAFWGFKIVQPSAYFHYPAVTQSEKQKRTNKSVVQYYIYSSSFS